MKNPTEGQKHAAFEWLRSLALQEGTAGWKHAAVLMVEITKLKQATSPEENAIDLLREARGELRLVSGTPKAMDRLPLTGPAIERLIPRIDAYLQSLPSPQKTIASPQDKV